MKVCELHPETTSGDEPTGNELHVVRLEGEIDLANSWWTGERILRELQTSGCAAALVDCSGLTLVDATGLAMMLHVQQDAELAHVSLVWSRLHGLPLRAIRIVGLDEQLVLIA
jgi:anti-anti-sigma factor